MIKEDEKAQPRIKLYRDKVSGMPKGDALVTYLKEPSVNLAVTMLDGTPFRYEGGEGIAEPCHHHARWDTFQVCACEEGRREVTGGGANRRGA